jgi:hypothetical protein
MDQSLASRIEATNSALMVDGNIDAVCEFFTPDYVAHLNGAGDDGWSRGDPEGRAEICRYRAVRVTIRLILFAVAL